MSDLQGFHILIRKSLPPVHLHGMVLD